MPDRQVGEGAPHFFLYIGTLSLFDESFPVLKIPAFAQFYRAPLHCCFPWPFF